MYPNFKILYFLMDFTALTFIYLFLAVPGLRCCMPIFSSCGGRGHSSLWCVDFSLPPLLLLQSTGSKVLT